MKVLITAPSLNENENVSGISTLVRHLIEKGRSRYVHFEAGRRDGEAADLKWAAKQAALPFRFFAAVNSAKPDIVHLNTAFISLALARDTALAAAARLARRPVLLHVHGGPWVIEEIPNPALKAAAAKLIQMAKVVVVFSDREEKALLERFAGAGVHVLPNAVPLVDFPNIERSPEGRKTIIFLGRLHASKGLAHIVEACRVLKEQGFTFNYVCYGAGPERENFISQMSSILGDDFSFC